MRRLFERLDKSAASDDWCTATNGKMRLAITSLGEVQIVCYEQGVLAYVVVAGCLAGTGPCCTWRQCTLDQCLQLPLLLGPLLA